eukprot:gene6033-11407_t
MTTVKREPKYIPPITTITIGQSGASFSTKPRSSQLWDTVRDGLGRDGTKKPYYGSAPNGTNRSRQANGTSRSSQAQHSNPYQPKQNGVGSSGKNKRDPSRITLKADQQNQRKYDDIKDEQQLQEEQFHYQTPDYNHIYDALDNQRDGAINDGKPSLKGQRVLLTGDSKIKDNTDNVKQNRADYADSWDREKNIDQDVNQRKRGSERQRSRRSGVENRLGRDSKTEIISTDRKDSDSGNDSESSRYGKYSPDEMLMGKSNGEAVSTAKRSEEEDLSEIEESIQSSSDEIDMDKESENEVEDKSKKKRCLKRLIKKCAPKFANRLLDAMEKAKNDCKLQFDDICKLHKEKNGKPIFTNYSCENGENNQRLGFAKKRLQNLLGGFYTRACTDIENLKNAAEDWLDEIKPKEDETWSQLDSEHGIRCVPHYDNQIEDHSIYVCSCCFNQVIDKDAHVNVRYLENQYGCSNPVIVMRSFENRPYLCERILASMSEKRRDIFLKRIGKKHHMKSGVHCVSNLPKMDEQLDEEKETANQTDVAQSDDDS